MRRPALAVRLILMLLITLLPVAFVSSSKAVSEAPRVEWSRTYPRPPATTVDNFTLSHIDEGRCFALASDGGYVIVGSIEDSYYAGEHSGPHQNYSGILMKTDLLGNVQWQKTNLILSVSQFIFQTTDSGYFVIAREGILLKIDSQGNMQSNKTLGVSISSAIQLSNGDYILVGNNWESSLIMKIDDYGYLLWNKTLSDLPINDVSSSIMEANGGGYFIVWWSHTHTETAGVSWPNLWLIKTDSNGDIQFTKTYNFDDSLGGQRTNPSSLGYASVTATKDGGYCLAGGTGFNDGIQYASPVLIKFDSKGDWQWHRTYATSFRDSSYFVSVVLAADGGFFAVGAYHSYPIGWTGSYDTPLLLKTDAFGEVLWNQTFSSIDDYHFGSASSVLVTKDGGYAVMGSLDSSIWLAKFAPQSTPPFNETSSFLTPLMVAIAVVSIIVGIALLVYLKKCKRQSVG